MPFQFVNSILSWFLKKRIHQIELFMKYPHEVQNELLEDMIKKASKTEYGKQYGFKTIENYEHFKNKVPIVSYEDLFPYIERLMKGEPKQALKAALGSVTPISVPASFEVKPDTKWYMTSSFSRIDTGGSTPKASAVRKMTFFGCDPTDGICAPGMKSTG